MPKISRRKSANPQNEKLHLFVLFSIIIRMISPNSTCSLEKSETFDIRRHLFRYSLCVMRIDTENHYDIEKSNDTETPLKNTENISKDITLKFVCYCYQECEVLISPLINFQRYSYPLFSKFSALLFFSVWFSVSYSHTYRSSVTSRYVTGGHCRPDYRLWNSFFLHRLLSQPQKFR